MSTAFDRELQHANDTEMCYTEEEENGFGYGNDDNNVDDDQDLDRHYGQRPPRNAQPDRINLRDLTQGNRGLPTVAGDRRSPTGALSLHNRVPGIAEMLDADSEVLRDLTKKPSNHINPAFSRRAPGMSGEHENNNGVKASQLMRAQSERERAKRQAEREKAKFDRHRQEMEQRSRFHKAAAETGVEIQTTVQGHHKAMVARTNQIGSMIEQLRSDVLEAQVEQQKYAKTLKRSVAEQRKSLDSQLFFIKLAVCFVFALILLTIVCRYFVPYVRNRWFGKNAGSVGEKSTENVESDPDLIVLESENPVVTSKAVPKKRTALDTSEELSIRL